MCDRTVNEYPYIQTDDLFRHSTNLIGLGATMIIGLSSYFK